MRYNFNLCLVIMLTSLVSFSACNTSTDNIVSKENVLNNMDGNTFNFDFETKIAPKYSDELGYGEDSFLNGNEQAFSVKLPEGDYKIEIKIKALEDTKATIWSEERRLMLPVLNLKKGKNYNYSILANTRNTNVKINNNNKLINSEVNLRGDDNKSRIWDDKLTISLSGENVKFQNIKFTPINQRRILLAGDSTVTDQPSSDFASWGQMLPAFFGTEVIINHARSGEAMRSFIASKRWAKLLEQTRKDDIVVIQFGHNDEKAQWPDSYADPEIVYPNLLKQLSDEVKGKGAFPVLVTPVARRNFTNGKINNTHKGYDDAVRRIAKQENIPLIDLTLKTTEMYEALGPQISPQAFGNKGKDGTHHNAYGAYNIACYVASSLVEFKDFNLKPTMKLICDSKKPLPPSEFPIKGNIWPNMRQPEIITQGNEPIPVNKTKTN